MIPINIVWATEYVDGLSAIYLPCSKEQKDEFVKIFREETLKTVQKVIDECGGCYEVENDVDFIKNEKKIDDVYMIRFSVFSLYYPEGETLAPYSINDSLNETLKIFKELYPNIEPYGCIAYPWSDVHCGEVVQYVIGEEKDFYPHIGEAIAEALEENEDYFFDVFVDFFDDLLEEEETPSIDFIDKYKSYIKEDYYEQFVALYGVTDIVNSFIEENS